MKKLIIALLAVCTTLPTQAQLFSSEGLGGALLGGIAGGVIGHNSGRRTAEGIAIGAGSGLLLGSLFGQARRDSGFYNSQPFYGYGNDPFFNDFNTGYPRSGFGFGPTFYSNGFRRPNYALTGAALGALGGAVIGHNNGRQTAEGAGIGAAAGLLLGGIAEQNARRREAMYSQPVFVTPQASSYFTPAFQAASAPAQPQQPATQNITIINNYYGGSSPMTGANSLFGR